MVFCRKCGGPMADGDHICLKCGAEAVNEDPSSEKKEMVRRLSEYQVLLSECEELEDKIQPPSKFPAVEPTEVKKRSFIKYFWPFIIGATVGFYIVYMLASFIAIQSAVDKARSSIRPDVNSLSINMVSDVYIGLFAAAIVALAIIFIGRKIAKSKQAEYNKGIDRMNIEIAERYKKGLLNQRMIDIHTENTIKMRQYESLVPEQYRTSLLVGQIIDLINEDKAQTVEEACALI